MPPHTRRYLLQRDIADEVLQALPAERSKMRCYFTKITPCKEIEYCRTEQAYLKIVREGFGEREHVTTQKNDPKAYKAHKKERVGTKIDKIRYSGSFNEHTFMIDRYRKRLLGITLLQTGASTLPIPLRKLVHAEVTFDPRYREKDLALFGDPADTEYNIYAIFREIELQAPKRCARHLFSQMRTIDAVRIALFCDYIQMRIAAKRCAEEEASDAFEAFRSYAARARALMRYYPKLFEKSLYRKVLQHLSTLKRATDPLSDLYQIAKVVRKNQKLFDADTFNAFERRIDERIAQERHRLRHLYTTRAYAIMMKQFELLLKEGTQSRYRGDNSLPILHTLKKRIDEEMQQIHALYRKSAECQDERSYRRLRKALKRTERLLLHFKELDPDRFAPFEARIRNVVQELTSYRNLSRKNMIIASCLEHTPIPESRKKESIDRLFVKSAKRELELSKKIDTHLKKLLS